MREIEGDLIVFDAACIFCSGFARFIVSYDSAERFRFVRAQSDLGREIFESHGLDPDDFSTFIVLHQGVSFTKLAGFCAAMWAIGWPWKALSVLDWLPKRFGNWAYDRVAQNRYAFGRRDCLLPSEALKNRVID